MGALILHGSAAEGQSSSQPQFTENWPQDGENWLAQLSKLANLHNAGDWLAATSLTQRILELQSLLTTEDMNRR